MAAENPQFDLVQGMIMRSAYEQVKASFNNQGLPAPEPLFRYIQETRDLAFSQYQRQPSIDAENTLERREDELGACKAFFAAIWIEVGQKETIQQRSKNVSDLLSSFYENFSRQAEELQLKQMADKPFEHVREELELYLQTHP